MTHTHTRLTALCPGLPGWAGTRKVNQSGFYWSKWQWVAVASAGPYASLHLVPDRQPRQHPPLSFLQDGCSSCRPTNSVKALKAKNEWPHYVQKNRASKNQFITAVPLTKYLTISLQISSLSADSNGINQRNQMQHTHWRRTFEPKYDS